MAHVRAPSARRLALAEARPFDLAFAEAIDYFRAKTNIPTEAWTDLWEGMHAKGFMVAGANREAVLSGIREAVDRAIAEGRTLEQFRQDFDRIVAETGWSHTGGRAWRSKVIFETNLRAAYAAGRWQQAQRVKQTRPWLRYVALLDNRTRPQHRAWHDTVLAVDDPWWDTFFPPNGWGCRCSVQSLNDRDLKRYGLSVSPKAPEVPMVPAIVSSARGQATFMTPQGVSPGFGHNPGLAGFGRGAERLALERHASFEPLDPPPLAPPLPALPVDKPKASPAAAIAASGERAIRELVADAFGGETILADPAGGRVLLGQALADHWLAHPELLDGRERYFPLLPEAVTDPAEIRILFLRNSVSGRVIARRRYIKALRLGDGVLILAVDADGHLVSGFSAAGDGADLAPSRSGALLWRRPPL